MIKTKNLAKKFGKITAVNNLSLEIEKGEIFGFLGPNGAGKTTTIRLLMDFIRPTSGQAFIFGRDAHRDSVEIKKQVGYLAGDVSLYDDYNGEYFLNFLANLNGGSNKQWVNELADRLDADLNRKIKNLSKGNKQKIAIIQALILKPKLLILDEPTTSLDPLKQLEFYNILEEMKKQGTTVFMSSHVLFEVEKICDRVGILKEGKLIAVKNIDEIQETKARVADIRFKDNYQADDFKLPGIKIQLQKEKHLQLLVEGNIDPLIKVLAKYHIQNLSFHEPALEDLFLKYYQE